MRNEGPIAVSVRGIAVEKADGRCRGCAGNERNWHKWPDLVKLSKGLSLRLKFE